MYTPEQVEQMIFQYCNERLKISSSMFDDYKDRFANRSLYNLSGMDSLDALEFGMFIENAFGVTMGEEEMYHLNLQSIIKKCVTLQKPKPAPKPQAEQTKPKPAPKPKAEQAKPQPVVNKPAEQPQVETKTMAGMMVCKLLGDVCNRRPTGKPNYDAQNWCEFVDCVLFKNFQKLR